MKILIVFGVVIVCTISVAYWLWTPDKTWESLHTKYLADSTDLVIVAGTRLHVRDTGPRDAAAVILLHGLASSLQTWDGWAQILERQYRVIRLDLPGSGLSPPDSTGDYTDARSTELLTALMDERGIKRAHFVGNSMGGRIAWTFAAKHAQRVGKLILVSPDGFASPGFEYGKAPDMPMIMRAMRYVLPKWMLRSNVAIAYSDPAALADVVLDRYYDLMLAPGSREALIARMEQTVLVPPKPLLQQISAPVLLLWGEKDAMIPIANAEDYLGILENARLVRLPTLGHVPHEEAPDISISPVVEFLAE